MTKSFRLLLMLSALAVPSIAMAGGGGLGGIAGATFPEQIIQESTSVSQLAQQAQQVRNSLQQLVYQAQNLKSLPQNLWNQAYGDLNQLTNIASQSNGLSYAMQNVNGAFQSEYPSYQPGQNYDQQYQQWNTTTSNSIAAALQQQGLQTSNFATQQQALAAINAASQSATGRMQVLQAGNQIAAMQVTQLQQLGQIESANSDAQLAYLKQQTAEKSASDAAETQAYQSWTSGSVVTPSGQGYGQFSNP
ncbi:P-type conjugative transfer protein TrbJ [Acidiphilium acidophilum]|uniref:P-type conjugative transfer protein TrbJ n=1 Tax=Acidiphilium acidophilum TaxID=76588 RepID=UPI002E8E6C92|nr:P-type conjugative transfer protein TrbJ [Acidiphilium acidophilum]